MLSKVSSGDQICTPECPFSCSSDWCLIILFILISSFLNKLGKLAALIDAAEEYRYNMRRLYQVSTRKCPSSVGEETPRKTICCVSRILFLCALSVSHFCTMLMVIEMGTWLIKAIVVSAATVG
ncbi:uncharacterized protein LOC113298393 isoform X2 [Papaver somniferum]|uniref:uncharacterized protein LOC113298393 isoform X2 n=1 Tax=Papaver somniferum TaxID=3469 RepID=UPI000E6F7807|nr:uncharacterized protein LOC113298393 isoform X2 [Papaver somniferum]